MRYRHSRLFPIVLVLLMLTSCGQSAEKPDLKQGMSQLLNTVQNLPPGLGIELQTEWPSDSAPVELPEYTAGTITASAVDGDGVLTIKIADTSKTDLYSYLDALERDGWIVTSNDTKAEAMLGLYTVTFALQGGGTVLQIDVYAEQAGIWPSDDIPPDILEPMTGVLVGTVRIQQTGETMWYFNYTYDGMDEMAAYEYMNKLIENGWRGDVSQLYRTLEWNGKHYEASIEIYETIKTRTTFTCDFYRIEVEPVSPISSSQSSDVSVIGIWLLGMVSGEELNTVSGRYEGGALGMGQVYVFHADGTYQALVLWSEALYFTGTYKASDGMLTLTDRTVEESTDSGKTWTIPESLPDASAHYVTGSEDDKAYLLIGEEGASLPLLDKKNALKYRSKG